MHMESLPYLILLFIGYLVYTLDHHKEDLPVPSILVIIGIFLSFIPFFSGVAITADILYEIFLPALLFTGAYQFSPARLKKYAAGITILGTAGLAATIFLSGWAIYLIMQPFAAVPLLAAFLIAAILTPTDPVSVMQILSQDLNDELVTTIVEGESLLNDGTSVVAFAFLFSWYTGSTPGMMEGTVQFAVVSGGGILVGLAGGWLFSRAVHVTHERYYQIMLSIVVAYTVFYTAEFVQVSGVLAVVFAGLVLSSTFSRSAKERHFREALDGFWKVVEVSFLSILFLMIGIAASSYLFHEYWLLAAAIFVVLLALRTAVVSTCSAVLPPIESINWKEQLLISISGVKGVVSVYLILKLESLASAEMDILLSISFSAVILSLLLQSIAIHPAAIKLKKRNQPRTL
ncbi:sodium:proton antiporter [Alkalicoccus saliphilus]|uniref:Sodium:proton antiporter n=2 Tax=Alkalicoccus saliphilus TaxID=200989 RepID=A0A2T4U8F3_9BACI|nr:sodium:proton antiporter [Alkalicoccus saliphilus]